MAYFKIGEHAIIHSLRTQTYANGVPVEVTSKLTTHWSDWGEKTIHPDRAYKIRLPYPLGPQRLMYACVRPRNLRPVVPPKPKSRQRRRRLAKPREPGGVTC